MRGLIEKRQGHSVAVVIAALFGASQSLPVILRTEVSLPVVVVAGLIGGVAGLFFFSWLVRNFSRWFGGQAELYGVRTAIGLSLFPWTFFFSFFSYLIFSTQVRADVMGLFPLFFAVFIYGFVILLLSLAAVLRLTPLKAFACLAVAILVSIFPLTLVARLMAGFVAA